MKDHLVINLNRLELKGLNHGEAITRMKGRMKEIAEAVRSATARGYKAVEVPFSGYCPLCGEEINPGPVADSSAPPPTGEANLIIHVCDECGTAMAQVFDLDTIRWGKN